ncbi:MAG: hypothetical protein GX638_13135 [Crenarchaeota archaeon]|nr:hypothetical protein [Thermoproteota archaeon]
MAILNEKDFDKVLKKAFKPKHKRYYICEICKQKIKRDMLGSYWCSGAGEVTEPICKKCNEIKKMMENEFEDMTTNEINSIIRSLLIEKEILNKRSKL